MSSRDMTMMCVISAERAMISIVQNQISDLVT